MSDLPSSRRLKPNTSQLPVSWYFDPQVFELERSEEHTSELQSQSNLVCRLLLEKKNKLLRRALFPTRRNALHRPDDDARPFLSLFISSSTSPFSPGGREEGRGGRRTGNSCASTR